MLHAWAPPLRRTSLPAPVISVDAALKTQTSLAPPVRVSGPAPAVNPNVPDAYTPGARFFPPSSVPTEKSVGCAAALLYAVVRAVLADSAVASAWCTCPVTVPGPSFAVVPKKPVTAAVGCVPRSPVTLLGPVLVTPAAARTAKLCAAPREGAVAAACRRPGEKPPI